MACGDTLLKRASLLPEDYLVGYLVFSRGYIGVGMANEKEDGHFQIRGLYRSGPFKQVCCPSLTQFYVRFGGLWMEQQGDRPGSQRMPRQTWAGRPTA